MDKICEQCSHPSDPHILVATLYCTLKYEEGPKEIPAGGHMYCPVSGCRCHSTWSIPDEVAGFDVVKEIENQGEPDPEAVRRVRGH